MVGMNRTEIGFRLRMSEIRNGIFIPKYYNPVVSYHLQELEITHKLVPISQLIDAGHISVSTGDEIGKMSYGTGDIPFIRTSDILNWEIKTDPKQGVSKDILDAYSRKQDVQAGDILFVRDGTYLVGESCVVTGDDLPCLYQSHILKFRVSETSPISGLAFFACLNTPIVKEQVRAKQFTADIIDTVGNRFREIVLPVPKHPGVLVNIAAEVGRIISERVSLREKIRMIPLLAQGIVASMAHSLPEGWAWRTEQASNVGFGLRTSDIKSGVLIPRYYDPNIQAQTSVLAETHDLISLRSFVNRGTISWDTGIEIGKMGYGTGSIPFVRTTDFANWELRINPKQGVSEEIYEANRQDVRAEDILVVRDGTYLVGTSCILTEADAKILYCGGIYKLRVENQKELDPYLLLALLNAPIVRRQMKSKQFTRDISSRVILLTHLASGFLRLSYRYPKIRSSGGRSRRRHEKLCKPEPDCVIGPNRSHWRLRGSKPQAGTGLNELARSR